MCAFARHPIRATCQRFVVTRQECNVPQQRFLNATPFFCNRTISVQTKPIRYYYVIIYTARLDYEDGDDDLLVWSQAIAVNKSCTLYMKIPSVARPHACRTTESPSELMRAYVEPLVQAYHLPDVCSACGDPPSPISKYSKGMPP